MEAARTTALELLQTAEILFERERFAHCTSMSVLAIEEAGKLPIIQGILLDLSDPAETWREYTRHTAKTQHLTDGIAMQVHNYFPGMPSEFAEAIRRRGPSSETLEKTKQRATYSDLLDNHGKCAVHNPTTIDWRDIADYVLCDARVFVSALRYYSAAELVIWLKHAKLCREESRTFETELPALERSLVSGGFITEGTWKNILDSARQETR
jgi:AbiV family abortive infection protein